jgi:hypothetical protein
VGLHPELTHSCRSSRLQEKAAQKKIRITAKHVAECAPTNDAEADAKTIRFTIGKAFRAQMVYQKSMKPHRGSAFGSSKRLSFSCKASPAAAAAVMRKTLKTGKKGTAKLKESEIYDEPNVKRCMYGSEIVLVDPKTGQPKEISLSFDEDTLTAKSTCVCRK